MLVTLDAKTVWYDEAYTANLAGTSYRYIALHGLGWEINMLPYYLGMRAWTLLFDDGAFALRLPSVFAAAAVVGLTFVVARRLHGDTVAWLAAAGVAVHATLFQYGQEARSYAFVAALTLVGSLLLLSERKRAMDAHGAIMALACYTHVLAVLAVVAHFIVAASTLGIRKATQSAAVTFIFLVPFAYAVWNGNQYSKIPPLAFHQIGTVVDALLGGGGVLGLAIAALAVLGAWRSWDGLARIHTVTVGVLLGGGIVLSIVRPVMIPRYFVLAIPSVVMLAAVGFVWLWHQRRALAIGVSLCSVAALATGLWSYAQWDKEDWIEAAEIVGDGTVSVHPEWAGEALLYHARQQGRRPQIVENGDWTVVAHGDQLPPTCRESWQFHGVEVGREC